MTGCDKFIGEVDVFCPQGSKLRERYIKPRFCSAIEVDHTSTPSICDARIILVPES